MFLRKILFFFLGGCGYVGLEFLWRGRSHSSMFVAGGLCFLLLGKLCTVKPRLPLAVRCLVGAGVITAVELGMGLLVNRDYRVWDYRQQPWNLWGQVCLLYSFLWIPVSLGAFCLHSALENGISRLRHP